MNKPLKYKYELFFVNFGVIFIFLLLIPIATQLISSLLKSGKILASLNVVQLVHTDLLFDVLKYSAALIILHILLSFFISFISKPIMKRVNIERRKMHLVNMLICFMAVWWIYAANSIVYQSSKFSIITSYVENNDVFFLLFIAISIIITLLFVNALRIFFFSRILKTNVVNIIRFISWSKNKKILISIFLIFFISAFIFAKFSSLENDHNESSVAESTVPNVIVIGIDSLRPKEINLKGSQNESATPQLYAFLKQSKVFETAYTPLARTYPSWNSILTGTYPIKHGVRFNLIGEKFHNRSVVNLAQAYSKVGYKTIYATDEKRFSNVDKRFGFHEIIGPKIGMGDFLLGKINDLPLSNLFSNTIVGKMLFPYTYANRAAYVTYKPETFDKLLESSLKRKQQRPIFLAVHFCLPHWPYEWSASSGIASELKTSYNKYRDTLKTVDSQFFNLIATLAKTNILSNSIVIILSDHGESFSQDVTHYSFSTADKSTHPKWINVQGHGTDVLNRIQHRVLLSFRYFTNKEFVSGMSNQVASLIDIAPTLADLSKLDTVEDQSQGISLRKWIENKNYPLKDRFIFVESGFSIPAIQSNFPDEMEAFSQGARHYLVSDKGRVILKEKSIKHLMNQKQLAVYNGDLTFALLPCNSIEEGYTWALIDNKNNTWYTRRSRYLKEIEGLGGKLVDHFNLTPINFY